MKILKVALLLILPAISYYGFYFEPNNLETTFHKRKIGSPARLLKIAHLSDLHTKGFGTIEEKLISAINAEKIDVIFITGDIATPNGTIEGYQEVLKKLRAPLGVYFVPGNWEYWTDISSFNLIENSGVTNLTNKAHNIRDNVWIIGFDDHLEGFPDSSLPNSLPDDAIKIALFHTPSFFKVISGHVDLAFAGHSHGGQVRLPFLEPFWAPAGTNQYYSGWYNEGSSEMYVSRGIGTSILPIRINCRPEVAFIELSY